MYLLAASLPRQALNGRVYHSMYITLGVRFSHKYVTFTGRLNTDRYEQYIDYAATRYQAND